MSQQGLRGEGGAKHLKRVSLLSGNYFLDSPFGSWKCKVLKVDRALPSAGTVCSVGEMARMGEMLDLVGFAATGNYLGLLCL